MKKKKQVFRKWSLKHLFEDKKMNALNYEDTPIFINGVRIKP